MDQAHQRGGIHYAHGTALFSPILCTPKKKCSFVQISIQNQQKHIEGIQGEQVIDDKRKIETSVTLIRQ